MAIILPQRWTRQPQYKVGLDPKWVAAGLNLALVPHGNAMVDYSPHNVRGSGGVQTSGSCTQGRTILRSSGSYAFQGLNQNITTFTRIAVIRQAATTEAVISMGASATTAQVAQFTTDSGQINLTSANLYVLATSTNAGLTTGRTHVVAVTYNHAASQVTFACDGRMLNTVTVTPEDFIVDGSGLLFVKQNGSNPYTGGMALHLDFDKVLNESQLVALTANPWQVFAPQRPLYFEEAAAVGGSGTSRLVYGSLVGGNLIGALA